jgi:hypothetical protein
VEIPCEVDAFGGHTPEGEKLANFALISFPVHNMPHYILLQMKYMGVKIYGGQVLIFSVLRGARTSA